MPSHTKEANATAARIATVLFIQFRLPPSASDSATAASSAIRRRVSTTTTTNTTAPRTVNCASRPTPTLTHAAPINAPSNAPTLHMPWNRDMIGDCARRSTVPACVFIATSRPPWNVPHNARLANSHHPDVASPTVIPASA